MRGFIALSVVISLAAACTSFSGSDTSATASTDGGRTDAAPVDPGPGEAGSQDAGADATIADDFEDGCSGWADHGANANLSSDAFSGSSACRICTSTGGFARKFLDGAFAAGSYQAIAFVKNDGVDAGSGSLQITLQAEIDLTAIANQENEFTASATYKATSSPKVVAEQPFNRFEVDIAFLRGATGCVLLDDLRIAPAP